MVIAVKKKLLITLQTICSEDTLKKFDSTSLFMYWVEMLVSREITKKDQKT